MSIYKINNQNLIQISEKRFDLEKDIQTLTEKNLEQIFGLKFIASEFIIQGLRIDTLAFDQESKSFVIIEYKKDRSISIIDQGIAYLNLLNTYNANFILKAQENYKNNITEKDIDISQSRVIFIARTFTMHQKLAINFNDLPFELWKVQKYENNIIDFEKIESPQTQGSFKLFSKKGSVTATITNKIKKYTIDDHFKKDWVKSRELFESINGNILNLDSRFEENPQKYYIGYKIGKSNIVALRIQKSKLVLVLSRTQPKDLKDPEKKSFYEKNSYKYYNQHLTNFIIKNTADIDYAMFLIKQVYEKFYK